MLASSKVRRDLSSQHHEEDAGERYKKNEQWTSKATYKKSYFKWQCSTPFRSNPIGGSEPDPGCSDTTLSVATPEPDPIRWAEPDRNPGTPDYHSITLSKMRGSDFKFGRAHKHLQIQ